MLSFGIKKGWNMRFSRKVDNQKQQFYTRKRCKTAVFSTRIFLSDYNAFLLQIPAIAERNILCCIGGGKWFWCRECACPEKQFSNDFSCCNSRCPHITDGDSMLSFRKAVPFLIHQQWQVGINWKWISQFFQYSNLVESGGK